MKLYNSDDPRENVKLLIGLLLVIVLAFVGFVLQPALAELSSLRATYDRLVAQVGVGRAKANELVGFAKQVSALKVQVGEIEERLSAEKAMPLVLRDAERLAQKGKVKLLSISPGGLTDKHGYGEQGLVFKLQATPAGLSEFISGLEALPYVVRVDSAEVQAGSLTSGGMLDVNLGATMYSVGKGGDVRSEAVSKPAATGNNQRANG